MSEIEGDRSNPELEDRGDPRTILWEKIKDREIEDVKSLLNKHLSVTESNDFDINWSNPDRNGSTFLHLAAEGSIEIVKLLVSNGADVNITDNSGISALHWAAYQGSLSIVKYLVGNGADINEISHIDGMSALHRAAWTGQPQTVEYLLESGVDPNSNGCTLSFYGWSPLHGSVRHGKTQIVVLLLEAGADPEMRDQQGKTPLDIAKDFKRWAIKNILENALYARHNTVKGIPPGTSSSEARNETNLSPRSIDSVRPTDAFFRRKEEAISNETREKNEYSDDVGRRRHRHKHKHKHKHKRKHKHSSKRHPWSDSHRWSDQVSSPFGSWTYSNTYHSEVDNGLEHESSLRRKQRKERRRKRRELKHISSSSSMKHHRHNDQINIVRDLFNDKENTSSEPGSEGDENERNDEEKEDLIVKSFGLENEDDEDESIIQNDKDKDNDQTEPSPSKQPRKFKSLKGAVKATIKLKSPSSSRSINLSSQGSQKSIEDGNLEKAASFFNEEEKSDPKIRRAGQILRKALNVGKSGGNSNLRKAVAKVMLHAQIDKNRRLRMAAKTGDIDEMKSLVGRGAKLEAMEMEDKLLDDRDHIEGSDIDTQYGEDLSPLLIAASYGQILGVKYLLDSEARINTINKEGMTSLHLAASNGFPNIVDLLLRRGADINRRNRINAATPLFLACENDRQHVVEVLLSYEDDIIIDKPDKNRVTPLIISVQKNLSNCVKLLLEGGADPNLKGKDGQPPIIIAVKNGYYECTDHLLKNKASINTKDKLTKKTIREIAEINQYWDIIDLLDVRQQKDLEKRRAREKKAKQQEIERKKHALDLVHNEKIILLKEKRKNKKKKIRRSLSTGAIRRSTKKESDEKKESHSRGDRKKLSRKSQSSNDIKSTTDNQDKSAATEDTRGRKRVPLLRKLTQRFTGWGHHKTDEYDDKKREFI